MMRIVYEYCKTNTGYSGYILNSNFGRYLSDRVGPRYRDDEGDKLLLDMDNTTNIGFDSGILRATVEYIPSRIAEILAECFLMDNHDVLIPYNRLRDSINPKASVAGPDIIGITKQMFVFGETKSSSEIKHPPSVVDGRSGLIAQINSIKLDREKRIRMIKWLGHKTRQSKSGTPHIAWRKAMRQYITTEGYNFKIYGILVRDTEPDELDVKKVHDRVSPDMHHYTLLDIVALGSSRKDGCYTSHLNYLFKHVDRTVR